MRIPILLLFVLGCPRLFAQNFGIYPTKMVTCVGGSAYARGYGNISGSFWQVSYDQGQNWTNVPSNEQYIEGGNGYLDLGLNNVIAADDQSYYRMCNPGTPNVCSVPDTLYVNSGVINTPQFVNPPSTVCTGNSALFSVTGGLVNDSITWTININGAYTFFYGVMDTNLVVHFPTTGTATISVLNFAGFGCAAAKTSVPLSITIQASPSSLAGTAGAGAICTSGAVYPGGQGAYNDPAQTSTATDGSCDAIASILPSGSSPVTGTVTSCVTLSSTAPTYNGIAYVPRYYNLEPSANASTSTATITLYLTQADFDAYNNARGSEPALPTGPNDATGIANLRVSQFHGSGTTPDTYVGGSGTIDPDDNNIVWDATNARWSVTFDITGFSGFFVSGTPIVPLPLTLTNFSGEVIAGGNQLNWQTSSEENTSYFEVQRALAGSSTFEDQGRVAAAGNSALTRQYSYTDELVATHPVYSYRLKMVDIDGRYAYSPIVTLQPAVPSLSVVVAPNPFVTPVSLNVASPVAGAATVVVIDMSGAKLVERSVVLQKGDNALDISMITGLPQGIYFLQVTTGTQQQTVKFVKE